MQNIIDSEKSQTQLEESKYYTPDISEFYVGFEFEEDVQGNNLWTKYFLTRNDLKNLEYATTNEFDDILNNLKKEQVRVKYLDEKDILSLGFEFDKTNKMRYWYKWEQYNERIQEDKSYRYWNLYLVHDPDENLIKVTADISDGNQDEKFFEGIIKNKSELKKLLEQLNIKYEQ